METRGASRRGVLKSGAAALAVALCGSRRVAAQEGPQPSPRFAGPPPAGALPFTIGERGHAEFAAAVCRPPVKGPVGRNAAVSGPDPDAGLVVSIRAQYGLWTPRLEVIEEVEDASLLPLRRWLTPSAAIAVVCLLPDAVVCKSGMARLIAWIEVGFLDDRGMVSHACRACGVAGEFEGSGMAAAPYAVPLSMGPVIGGPSPDWKPRGYLLAEVHRGD
jgi:hypothetical protein